MKLRSVIAGLVALSVISPAGLVRAAMDGGPCNGESSPSRRVEAHLVGRESHSALKVVFRAGADASGTVSGKLIVERGSERLTVVEWCRLWVGGDHGGAGHEGAVHVLGIEKLQLGPPRMIRVDVMTDEGGRLRVRARKAAEEKNVGASVESGHGWIPLTGEGWLQLTRLRIQSFLS